MESFAPAAAPAALLPQVPTPKPPVLGGRLQAAVLPHPDLDLHLFSMPGCKPQWLAAALATAPGVVLSETRWGGQPGHFGSPALLPLSSRVHITCPSGRYDVRWQNAGANTRVPWSCSQSNACPAWVGSAPEDGPPVLLRAPRDWAEPSYDCLPTNAFVGISWQTIYWSVSVYLKRM